MNILPEREIELEQIMRDDLMPCMKKPIPIKATQMFAEFRVKTLEGDYKQGSPEIT